MIPKQQSISTDQLFDLFIDESWWIMGSWPALMRIMVGPGSSFNQGNGTASFAFKNVVIDLARPGHCQRVILLFMRVKLWFTVVHNG